MGKSVIRNRMKRRMREAVRLNLETLTPEWSIVFNPRKPVLDALFPDIEAEVRKVFSKCANS
jgi:ribonuclease P protein component